MEDSMQERLGNIEQRLRTIENVIKLLEEVHAKEMGFDEESHAQEP